MRLGIAKCSVDYAGRLWAHLPLATSLLMFESDGSVLVVSVHEVQHDSAHELGIDLGLLGA